MAGAHVYTETERMVACRTVAYYEGNTNRASTSTGIPRPTLSRWWSELGEEERRALTDEVKESAQDRWQRIHDKATARLEREMEDMPKQQLATIAGISFDKLQLLKGAPTAIQGAVNTDAKAIAASLDSILGPAPKNMQNPSTDKGKDAAQEAESGAER